ncbi:MAG: autotransporter outer membrane beta-barrel domain-containing protein [Pseudomonadota bacterium]
MRFTAGASLAALLAALSWPSSATQAQGLPPMVSYGANGSNGEVLFNFRTEATAGQNAQSVVYVSRETIRMTGPGNAIEIGSVGGYGGYGDVGLIRNNIAGARGGSGELVSLTQYGSITGGANRKDAGQLISLYSRGGIGGAGLAELNWSGGSNNGGGIGAGGRGGSVIADIWGTVAATGDFTRAIYAVSEGGAAGARGHTTDSGTARLRRDLDAGGTGGAVNLTINYPSKVTTAGNNATAIFAASDGGAGGNGTSNRNSYYGSNGGAGGKVTLVNHGAVVTSGTASSAIVMQAIGGRGGDGGGGAFSSAAGASSGGNGGTIQGVNIGWVHTQGNYSFGMLGQSVGGVGGSGTRAAFSDGGDGGAAGAGGAVTLTNEGTILTYGIGSTALLAQSIGGGNALDAFQSSAPSTVHTNDGSGGKGGIWPGSTGGKGGAGGVGGTVEVFQSGTITTTGDNAYGALIQSVGGGGGTGGATTNLGAFISVGLGGAGGGGGNGGTASFTGTGGSIHTEGTNSVGLLIQSIGGGGGTGGYASAISATPGLALASAVGGTGGGGGNGGTATVDNATQITTRGDNAAGILASGIGGGGGNGGDASAYSIALPLVDPKGKSYPSFAYSGALGGDSALGGTGGTVSVTNRGYIETLGTGSSGIQAASIGGGGGTGGNAFAYALAISAPDAGAYTVTSAVGGKGGGGGSGQSVEVTNSGTILTFGDGSFGILAQSIGGGGGNAGSATATSNALSLKKTMDYSQSVGGKGGKGGSGDRAYVQHSGLVQTEGDGAMGIAAQSIGGGGGNGGGVSASAVAGLSFDKTLNSLIQKLPLADAISAATVIGGAGGEGGGGGTASVDIMNRAVVRTYGSQADGVFAQSIGGGGGTGGGGSVAATGKWSGKLSIGGTGGAGGAGGLAQVNNFGGTIETYGDASHGIFAESVGGGGGSGGSLTADTTKAPDTVGKLWSTLKEAVGVEAYQKWAADKGNAETKEKLDEFIKDIQSTDTYKGLADSFKKSDFYKQMQSFWKGADDYLKEQKKNSTKLKGDVGLTVSLGGAGGSGNMGGMVKVENNGFIATAGDLSHGIFAQSIGGGGGQGGLAYSSGSNKTNIGATLGGNGGSGNVGNEVTVTNSGTIITLGDSSYGILAQSIGGGGGVGVGATSSENKNLVLTGVLGGTGGSGNTGGMVLVTNRGSITTSGAEAHGIVAQSVGGGGGAFQMNPANSDNATKGKDKAAKGSGAAEEVSDATMVNLLKALGIEQVPPAVEDPADKKPSDKSGSVTLGSSGGKGADGNRVHVTQAGTITTTGDGAFGILAQSVGGGGGISNAAGSTGGVKYAASLGGSGGAAGNGGDVMLDFDRASSIGTFGDYATAVFAQSVGGGGGYGGASVLQGYTVPFIGGSGGASGDGGGIQIRTRGNEPLTIRTVGTQSHGIFAQSLGGGGGTVSGLLKTDSTVRETLTTVSGILEALHRATGGTGTIADNIDKVPEAFQGIVRLLGNDKDTVDSALTKLKDMLDKRSASTGTGGLIDIHLRNANIAALGLDSYGIFAQSGFQQLDGALDASRRGRDIMIDFGGTLTGGAGAGAAIGMDGGSFNTVTIRENSTISAVSGHAIRSSFGEDRIKNFGTIIGDMDLSVGRTGEYNEVFNERSGVYRTAGTGILNLGGDANRGRFFNYGTFDIGGVGTISSARITNGQLDLGGSLLVDVTSVAAAGAPSSDLLTAEKVTVQGVSVVPYAVKGLLPGSFTVLKADALTSSRQAVSGASAASPISWALTTANNTMVITPSANFVAKAPSKLTDTERSVLNSLQTAWNASSADMAGTFANMANLSTAAQYELAIGSLATAESLGQPASNQTMGARKSLNAALSCPVFEGDSLLIRESQCLWTRITGARMEQYGGGDYEGFTQDAVTYRMGAQWEFAPNWFVGATAGFTTSWLTTSDGLNRIDGNSGDVSVALKHQMGAWLFAGALHGSYGRFESNNIFTIGGDTWQADNSSDVWTGGLRLRAAYEFAFTNWYLRPYADLDVLYTYMPGYTLSGDGATLQASSMKGTSVAVELAVEAGTRIDLAEAGWLRPYAVVGATFLGGETLTQDVQFSDGAGTGISFTSTSNMPDAFLDLGAGLQFMGHDKYELRGEYRAQIAEDFLNQELALRMSVRF